MILSSFFLALSVSLLLFVAREIKAFLAALLGHITISRMCLYMMWQVRQRRMLKGVFRPVVHLLCSDSRADLIQLLLLPHGSFVLTRQHWRMLQRLPRSSKLLSPIRLRMLPLLSFFFCLLHDGAPAACLLVVFVVLKWLLYQSSLNGPIIKLQRKWPNNIPMPSYWKTQTEHKPVFFRWDGHSWVLGPKRTEPGRDTTPNTP